MVMTNAYTTAASVLDFRNQYPSQVEALFREQGFPCQRILNFRKAFREQDVEDLRDLKGIRKLEPVLPWLPISHLRMVKILEDSNGKFQFSTEDDFLIESVFMPSKSDISICISVQAGCRFGCTFCNTGKMGFRRNLLPHEMLEQIRQVYQRTVYPARLGCVSLMGMGEPFDNLRNCHIAFEWIRSGWGWDISAKKVTFSTSGIGRWDEFFSFNVLPNLAISLHAALPEKRQLLMPRSVTTLSQLQEQIRCYWGRSNRYVSIVYCLLGDVNDSDEDADALISFSVGLPCKINLLSFNEVNRSPFKAVSTERFERFRARLRAGGISVLHRKSLGTSIRAGCGQLGTE
jgi:23S rRNA (adenine2503-C2)-methyltransferase